MSHCFYELNTVQVFQGITHRNFIVLMHSPLKYVCKFLFELQGSCRYLNKKSHKTKTQIDCLSDPACVKD
jgi:hypothetical protein